MALKYAHGAVQWLAADAVSTTYPVTGLGFRPKAIRFFHVGIQSSTDAANQTNHWRAAVGFALSATNRRCMGSQSQDAAGTSVCTTGYRTDCVAMTLTSTPALDGALDLQSIDSDGFTLVVDDQAPVGITVFWEAWGGDDITNAIIGEIAEPGATGSVNYSCGFRPDVLMFAGVQGTAAANTVTRNDAALMVGATNGPANNIVAVANEDDASTTTDTDRYARSGECLAQITVAGGNPSARASLANWLPSGFTLSWAARATTNRRYMFLAIQGGAWAVGSTTIAGNSASATATVTTLTQGGIPFQPVGISTMGCSLAASAAGTSSTEAKIGLGAGSSTSSRQAMGLWSENANATADEIDQSIEYDAIFAMPSATGTAAEAIDIDAILSNGFRLIVDVAGGVASEWIGYVACGSMQPAVSIENYLSPEIY